MLLIRRMSHLVKSKPPVHLFLDADQTLHRGGPVHPEHPSRIAAIELRVDKWDPSTYVLHKRTDRVRIKDSKSSKSSRGPRNPWNFVDDGDTYVTAYTPTLLMRGNEMIEEAVMILTDKVTDCAFVCIRPPGHHANLDSVPNGFCHQNNAWTAVQAFYKQQVYRIAIFDFDAHHGDGTEDCVRRGGLRSVKFCSTHAFGPDIYPGTGSRDGNSNTILNIPLAKGCTGENYQKIVDAEVVPFLADSDVIIVSAGYDGHEEDPMGLLQFHDSTYRYLGSVLRSLGKPLLYLLEGGYEPATLARSLEMTLQ